MSEDVKAKRRSTTAPAVRGAAVPLVRRDEALRVAAGLTEAERDLVAGILDWQIEGLEDDHDPCG
jgi:hypothetical protein